MSATTVDVPTSDYDPFTEEAILDAHRYDGALRNIAPAVYLERYDVWAVARFRDVHAILPDHERFTSNFAPTFVWLDRILGTADEKDLGFGGHPSQPNAAPAAAKKP